ncbi:MAG: hypothetical protein F6K09_23570 [Merismopedia sp. SIO2A8]|nr:hypothetical protein [Merismopedia sp. SIO2A8]
MGDRMMGLDGVLAQQANYAKSGFHPAHRSIRYEGKGISTSLSLDTMAPCVPLSSLSIDEVIAYDRPFFPDDRADFINTWITQPEHYGLAVLEQNALAGYGVIRPCHTGYRIGPLFANTADIAHHLFCGLCDRVPPNIPFYLDAPVINKAAIALVERYQMTPVFEAARMYRGAEQTIRPLLEQHDGTGRVFGITTFELG